MVPLFQTSHLKINRIRRLYFVLQSLDLMMHLFDFTNYFNDQNCQSCSEEDFYKCLFCSPSAILIPQWPYRLHYLVFDGQSKDRPYVC